MEFLQNYILYVLVKLLLFSGLMFFVRSLVKAG